MGDFGDLPPGVRATAFVNADGDGEAGSERGIGAAARRIRLAPRASAEERLAVVKAAKNPLLEASQPLLRALADMPPQLDPEAVQVYFLLLEQEVFAFQSICSAAQIKHEHAVAASYSLCTALDEAANSTIWGGGTGSDAGVWALHQLAGHFHGDGKGGDKFFLLIGRLAASPQEHLDLLEVMYLILGLGFEGRFRAAGNGRRQLETIRNRLYTMLSSAREDVAHELSPHWKGAGPGKFRPVRGVPVWFTVVLLTFAVGSLWCWHKYQLVQRTVEVQQHIEAIGALRPPAGTPVRALRLKELLRAEIAAGLLDVVEDDHHSAVTFKGDEMFVRGQARMSAATLPALAKVADQVNQVTGTVEVIGHSDNQPIHTREFPTNVVLSEKRASAAAAVLRDKGVVDSRMTVRGAGDAEPVADNNSVAGRARNRRVEIVVRQGVVQRGRQEPNNKGG